MSWAKLDDRFWTNRKVRSAWLGSRASIGLHVMVIAYCAQNETDGHVDADLVAMLLPAAKERDAAVSALIDAGLWTPDEDGWAVHDYLEFNESRSDADERRRKDSERKRRRNPTGSPPDSTRNPRGFHRESLRIPSEPSRAPAFDPTRPDPTLPPRPPSGGRERNVLAWKENTLEWARECGVAGSDLSVLRAYEQCKPWQHKGDPSKHFRTFAAQFFSESLTVEEAAA